MGQFVYPIFGDKNLDLGFFLMIVLLSSGIHEFAHAWTAYQCGDESVKDRVTLNPMKHIGFFPTFVMPCLIYFLSQGSFIFGSAKPVPINIQKLKRRGKDTFFVALAGPKSNLFLVFLLFIVMLMSKFFVEPSEFRKTMVFYVTYNCIFINLLLCFMNAFPFPPLDGFKAFCGFFPVKIAPYIFFVDLIGISLLLYIFYFYPVVIYKLLVFIRDDTWEFIWDCYVKFPI